MNIAVFPGSFDPFTNAHKDIVDRAVGLFDKIYIAIGINSSKKGMMDSQIRKRAIESVYTNQSKVEVVTYTGLTVEFCKSVEANYILRGLRNANDLVFEDAIAQNNLILAPDIETYFLLARSGTNHISSTIVRDILVNGGPVDTLVPAEVLKYIK